MSKKKIVVLYFFSLALLPAITFPLDIPKDQDVIWEAGRNAYIRYAEQDDAGFGANDHPVDLQIGEIKNALGSLRFPHKGSDDSDQEQTGIFTAQQIDTLSQNLATGLANAQQNQDIIFSLEKSVKRFLGTRGKRLYVAGRAFFKDGRLNIIIGDHDRAGDEAFEAAYDPTRIGIVAYDLNHGRRTKSSRVLKDFDINAAGVEYKELNGQRRNDWLVIHLKSASEAVDASLNIREAQESSSKREESMELVGSEEAGATVPAARLPPATAAPAAQSFEQRLTTLKTLRDKGLITDEEYEMKRRQILDEL